MGKWIIAVCVLLLALSFGCTAPSGGGSGRSFWVMGWQYLAGVSFMIVALLLALGYMASVFLSDDKMRAWVKKELGQLFFSMVILLFAIGLVGVLDQWLKTVSYISDNNDPRWTNYVNAICCTPGAMNCPLDRNRACHVELATDFLQTLYETARMNAIVFLDNYWTYGFLSNLSVSMASILDDKQGSMNFSPFAGLSVPADFFSMMFELTVKIMMLIRAQQIFLDYLWYALFPVMLSMGLVLRIFYFSRKLGGLLIAMALSAYIVFPMFYVVTSAILFGFLDSGNWTQQGTMTPFGSNYNTDPGTGGTPLPMTDPNDPFNYGSSQESGNIFDLDPNDPGSRVNIDLCNDQTQPGLDQQTEMLGLADGFISSWRTYEGSRWYEDFLSFAGLPSISPSPWSMFGPRGPISSLAAVMVFTVVVPFLALMTMLASIKYFSPLLGGDVEISVLSRLI